MAPDAQRPHRPRSDPARTIRLRRPWRRLYTCPAGHTLHPRPLQRTPPGHRVCHAQRRLPGCTASAPRRRRAARSCATTTELIERAWAQARTPEARRDRRRRRSLMERSFAQAANLHHFKRARWRRLWRQQIQDWLIAACQNVRILVSCPCGDHWRSKVRSGSSQPGLSALFPTAAPLCRQSSGEYHSDRSKSRFSVLSAPLGNTPFTHDPSDPFCASNRATDATAPRHRRGTADNQAISVD